MLTRENMNKYQKKKKKMQHTLHSEAQADESLCEGKPDTGKERRLLGKNQ